MSFLKRLCLEAVTVPTDGEPELRELAEELAMVTQMPTRTRTTPAHSSQMIGAVASTIRHLTGQMPTILAHLESMHGVTLNPVYLASAATTRVVADEQILHTRQWSNSV